MPYPMDDINIAALHAHDSPISTGMTMKDISKIDPFQARTKHSKANTKYAYSKNV